MRQTKPGSALLLAALTATLLAGAAAIMLIDARAARGSTGETLRLERARLEAQALLATALVRLDADGSLPASGVLFAMQTGGSVTRQDAAGLVDINAAPPDRLAALLVAVGYEPEAANVLADRIADWRDEDDLVRLHGAEREEYETNGRPPPGNRPFVVETEISSVLGASSKLARCLAPFLTTYSGAPDLDPAAAPMALRQMLNTPPASFAPSGAPPFGRVVRLTADAPFSEHAVMRLTLWARLTGDSRRPFVVHRASEEIAPRHPAQAAEECTEPEDVST